MKSTCMCQQSVFTKQCVYYVLCVIATLLAVKGLNWCLYNEAEPNMASGPDGAPCWTPLYWLGEQQAGLSWLMGA